MALTAAANYDVQNDKGTRTEGVIKSGVTIFQKAICVKEIAAPNYVRPATDDAGASVFVGVSLADYPVGDNVGMAGFYDECDMQLPLEADIAADDVGKQVYAFSDASVTLVSTVGAAVGTLLTFTAGTPNVGYVRLSTRPRSRTSTTAPCRGRMACGRKRRPATRATSNWTG